MELKLSLSLLYGLFTFHDLIYPRTGSFHPMDLSYCLSCGSTIHSSVLEREKLCRSFASSLLLQQFILSGFNFPLLMSCGVQWAVLIRNYFSSFDFCQYFSMMRGFYRHSKGYFEDEETAMEMEFSLDKIASARRILPTPNFVGTR